MNDSYNTFVEEYTTPSPNWVYEDTLLPVAMKMMVDLEIRHVIVRNETEMILGIISERDLLTHSRAPNYEKMQCQEIMNRKVYTVSPQSRLCDVAFEMSSKKYGSAVVYDETTKEVGIFTVTDALNALVEVLRGELKTELCGDRFLS